MLTNLYIAAREEGKYRAIGGHRARPRHECDGRDYDAKGRALCAICGRPLTWREDRHAAIRRRSR